MKIEEVKKLYKDEWVLAEILKEDELGNPIDIKVIAHSKNRDDTYKAMKSVKEKYTYHFYTGEIPKKGYAVVFTSSSFEKDKPVIVLDVVLTGSNDTKKKVKMAVDTGATYVMIPWEIADALNIKPEMSEEKIEMITASGVERAPVITLDSVSVFDKTVNNVKALAHDLPQKSYVDGLLGLSFLKNFILTINFKEGIIELN